MTRPPREPDLASGNSSPTIVDSRRLMGPNLMHAGLGAVLEVSLDDAAPVNAEALLRAWHERVSFLADALEWTDAESTQRVYAGGASLFVHAPIDQLMTATEVCESAWVFAESVVVGNTAVAGDAALESLLAFSRNESNARLRAAWDEARRLGLNLTFDDITVSIGTGAGSQTWPLADLPSITQIDWLALRDIPIVLVTGSNGKTTVVRMVAAMARADGHTVGYTCTDGVWIGGAQVESGDWSGPAGARRVLQDTSVTLAVLETARGGLLRRGLAVQRASVAAIVTLSPDHFGDYGITDLATLAEAKMVVGRAVSETGTLVYNGDVPVLVESLVSYTGHAVPVSIEELKSFHAGARGRGEERLQNEIEVHSASGNSPRPRAPARKLSDSGVELTLAELHMIPATLHGTATHNVLNAAIALAIANELELGEAAVKALKTFGADPRENMGRLMLYEVGGVTVVVDYAHNPQSVTALIDATRHIPAPRRAIALGTGGDRDDLALQEIARAAFDSGVIDFYIAKEMPKFLRGREAGSISGVFLAALRALGVTDSQLTSTTSDMDAAHAALQWAQASDLILLAVHDDREAVLALIAKLARDHWSPGARIE